MATCAVSGTVLDPSGTAVTSVTVAARIDHSTLSGVNLIAPTRISTTTDSSGNFVLTIQQSISVIFTIQYPVVGTEPLRDLEYVATIPATTTASFSNIIVIE